MDDPGFVQSVIGKIGEFLIWLKEKMQDEKVRRDTLLDIGLDPNKEVELQIPDESLNNIDQYRKSVNPDDAAFKSAVNDLKTIYTAIKDFILALVDDPRDVDTYIWLFLQVTLTNYIRLHYPGFYWVSQLLGFIVESKVTLQTALEGQGLAETLVIDGPKVIAKNIWNLITNPLEYVKNLWRKITEPRKGPGHLEHIESAESLSELMTILAGLFTVFENKIPESRYLYGWSTMPRNFEESSKEELKNSIHGNILLHRIRKKYKQDFPIDNDNTQAWVKVLEVLGKSDPNPVEKKILAEYNLATNRWKRGNWSDNVSERAFSFDLKLSGEKSDIEKRLGATLFFVSDEEISEHFNKDSDIETGSLGGVFISLNGEVTYKYAIDDHWEFILKTSSGDVLDMYLTRLPDANILGDMRLDLALKRKADPETGASYSLPQKTGTRLAIGELFTQAFVSREDWGIQLGLKENAVVIAGGEGDSFLKEILPSGDVPLKFSLTAGLSKKKGFQLDHDIDALKDAIEFLKDDKQEDNPSALVRTPQENRDGLTQENKSQVKEKQSYELLIPLHKDLGLLYFDSVSWDYGAITREDKLGAYLKVLATFSSKIGPVKVKVEKTGLGAEVTMPNQDEDLGTSDVSFGFSPPKGVALSLDTELISGGGFLELDFENHRYAGVLTFKLALKKRDIGLVAVGLINTRLPNGAEGFSMLISIGVFFSPAIPLAFGFTLVAVGGLVGIHRTMKVDILREQIRSGSIRSIMFPENVIENASKIISDLRAVFPPEKKHYVIAPFFKFGYSNPTVLEVDLGILIEFPFKGRLILLGSLAVYLPNKDVEKRLGEIHVDIFGDLNFAASYILIEGRLRDSSLVGIALTGGFAFMLDWGSAPQFLLSIGGYHPRYKKPERFPEIPRVTALIKKGEDIRLSCQYYQAITSNSYQIGFSAELVVKKGNARAYGFLGFNALLQFDPFYFETDIRISVEVSYRGRSFFGIDMEFMLSGPEPWRAQGYAKIKVLFFSLKVKFNISWGGEQKAAPVLINPDALLEKLKIQLGQSSAWSAKLPDRYGRAESLRSLEETEKQDQLFMHPSGYLELRQNLIPLNKTIEKLGTSHIETRTSYQISDYTFGQGEPVDSKKQKPVMDHFSRGQFEDLPDSEKLSTPDFDLMLAGIEVAPDQVYDISPDIQFTANDFEDILLDDSGSISLENPFNWQGEREMNLSAGRKPIDASRPEELFGVIQELPDQKGKAYKILSRETLEAPGELQEQYFISYSGARDYLQSKWPKEEQGIWQILQAEPEENEEIVIINQ